MIIVGDDFALVGIDDEVVVGVGDFLCIVTFTRGDFDLEVEAEVVLEATVEAAALLGLAEEAEGRRICNLGVVDDDDDDFGGRPDDPDEVGGWLDLSLIV